MSSESTDKGCMGGMVAGCGHEHHKGDDQHLGEMAQTILCCIVLQIGVSHEIDDGIETQTPM